MTPASCLLLPLLLAAPLQAQNKVAYSSLQAKVGGFRFFPSGKESFIAAERVYRTSFDSATIQHINFELDIDYPKTESAVTFALVCRYQGPGTRTGSHELAAQIGAGSAGSTHAGGWGQVKGGFFAVGTYRVSCRDGSTEVASDTFTVARDQQDIPAIKGMVTRVRVMENARRLPPAAERVFGWAFDSTTARYISTEIQLDFPKTAAAAEFPIECTYKYPNGETRNFRIDAKVNAGWTDSAHTGGWGNEEPGSWAKGVYQIACHHLDRQIVQRTFRIS